MPQPSNLPLATIGAATPELRLADETEVQFNFRVARNLKSAFLAAADMRGTTGTEALTRFMISYIADATGQTTLHIDGTECPLAKMIGSFSEAILAKLTRDHTLDFAAQNAVAKAQFDESHRRGPVV